MKKIFRFEKRFGALFLMFLLLPGLLISSGIHARADVIYEPDDDFYNKHREECTLVDAAYLIDRPDGTVKMYASPENAKVIAEFENGEKVIVNFSYTDRKGREWASVTDWRDHGHKNGWIPMDYLYEAYSDRLFRLDYGDEIRQASASDRSSSDAAKVWFFDYPGAPQGFQVDLISDGGETASALPAQEIFTDEEGRDWGRIGYYYGYRDVWFCLDAPEKSAEELYPHGLPERDKRNKQGIGSSQEIAPEISDAPEIKPSMNVTAVVLAAALIGLAVAAAVIILIILAKHAKKKS